jgi:hypothetical protein
VEVILLWQAKKYFCIREAWNSKKTVGILGREPEVIWELFGRPKNALDVVLVRVI